MDPAIVTPEELSAKLRLARKHGDVPAEVDALLAIARQFYAEDDLGNANANFHFAARLIRMDAFDRLHEALSVRALVMRQRKRYQEWLDFTGRLPRQRANTPARWRMRRALANKAASTG